MPISFILTPFDHFHFGLALAVKCIPDLRVRPKVSSSKTSKRKSSPKPGVLYLVPKGGL